MNRDDELAIELAAERRRYDESKQRELDARRAELPRALRQDAHEQAAWWMRLLSMLARRSARRP